MINFENIDGVLVSKDLFKNQFTCDLKKCKGACCTMKSEYGAPLKKEEIPIIEQYLSEIKKNLSEKNIKEIDKNNFWEEKNGELMTRSINKKDCVFVYYEGDIAKCAIEKTYNEHKIDFIKPISCHLFPIRVSDFGGDILKYEVYDICQPAVENGKKTKLNIAKFCETAIKRAYSNNFFNKLMQFNGK